MMSCLAPSPAVMSSLAHSATMIGSSIICTMRLVLPSEMVVPAINLVVVAMIEHLFTSEAQDVQRQKFAACGLAGQLSWVSLCGTFFPRHAVQSTVNDAATRKCN